MSGTTPAPTAFDATSWRWRWRWAWWTVFIALVASAVAMAELDRLISQFLTEDGQAFSMSGAEGLPPQPDAWSVWWSLGNPQLESLIAGHAAIDIVFSIAYVAIGFAVFRATGVRFVRFLWVPVLVGEVLESVLILFQADGVAIAVFSWIKWLSLLACVGTAILVRPVREYLGRHLTWWARAFFVHRVSLVIVVALGLFALLPKGELFDQFPDAIRRWSDADVSAWSIVLAVAVFLFLAFVVFVFARRNMKRAEYDSSHDAALKKNPGFAIWFIVPAVFLVTAIVVVWPAHPGWAGAALAAFLVVGAVVTVVILARRSKLTKEQREAPPGELAYATFGLACGTVAAAVVLAIADTATILPVDGQKLLIFVALAVVIPGVSLWIPEPTASTPDDEATREQKRRDRLPDAARVATAGQLLAALAFAVFGLGLVRAFVAPAALDPSHPWWIPIVLGIAAAIASLIVVDLASWLVDWANDQGEKAGALANLIATADDEDSTTKTNVWLRYGSLGVGLGLIVLFVGWPLRAASGVEVIATVGLVLLAWLLIIGNADAEAKDRPSLPLWGWIGLRSDPVLAVLLIGPILLSQLNADPALHAIERRATTSDEATRTQLGPALDTWVQNASCTATFGGVTVRPLVLVAAEGGGIRAAAWTARVVDELDEAIDCPTSPIFLSSGASGGSVGLVLARGADEAQGDPEAELPSAFAEATTLAHASGLAAAASGLLVGDVLAGATGVRVPTEGYPDGGAPAWQDRAAHLQWSWRTEVESLRADYDHDSSPSTGWLVLNTTAVGYNCRGVISQLDLGIPRPYVEVKGSRIPNCSGDGPAVANTIDIEDLYDACPLAMDWATAAMTSARFPIITPAGRTSAPGTDACGPLPDVQLADGGIAENSGLGNIADLMPELTTRILEVNSSGGTAAPIVPIVVYASNEPGKDLGSDVAPLKSELGVALSLGDAQSAQNSAKAWLQRIGDALDTVCPADDTDGTTDDECRAAMTALAWQESPDAAVPTLGGGVFLVAPESQPAIAVPLGWVLSDLSLGRIDSEIRDQCEQSPHWPSGYAGLAELRAAFGKGENDCLPETYLTAK